MLSQGKVIARWSKVFILVIGSLVLFSHSIIYAAPAVNNTKSKIIDFSAKSARVYRASQLPKSALLVPKASNPTETVRAFIAQQLQPKTADSLRVDRVNTSGRNGQTHLRMTQEINGLKVYGTYVKATVNSDGSLNSVIENVISSASSTIQPANVDAVTALANVLAHYYPGMQTTFPELSNDGIEVVFDSGTLLYKNPVVTKNLIPLQDGILEEGFLVETWDNNNVLRYTLINSVGRIVREELRTHNDSYRIFPDNPANTSQIDVQGPGAGNAQSPSGWVTGTSTSGNNVNAYRDANNDNTLSAGDQPIAATKNFLYDANLLVDPAVGANPNVAVTNLFYLVNVIHDKLYKHGFTEAAGNFQTNNFGLGGLGNDPVLAEAQDSINNPIDPNGSNRNNANFATPNDGSKPRMQMYIWTVTNPQRDGSLDSDIVWHEYGHGLTWRMVGDMGGAISGAIGEGMGDVLSFLANDDDIVGEYSSNKPKGIRSAPYAGYPNTYGNIGVEVHKDGEVYAAIIWHLWELFQQNGISKDTLYDYLIDGLNFTASNPSFEDMRDGILAAAASVNPAHECLVWEAFAKYGVGNGAIGSVSNFVNVLVSESYIVANKCFESPIEPPAAVNDLTLSIVGPSSVNITFTITGDNGVSGAANYIDVRYSLNPITDTNFSNATRAQFERHRMLNPGTLEVIYIDGLPPSIANYIAVKIVDESGNTSDISDVMKVIIPATLHFDDPLNNSNNWTIANAPNSPVASLWHLSGNRASSPSTAFYYGIEGVLNYDAKIFDSKTQLIVSAENSSTITSIPINLSNKTNIWLTFKSFLQTENASGYDIASVEVSKNNGLDWVEVFSTSFSSNKWVVTQEIDLAAFDGQSIQLRFGFNTVDAVQNAFEGWVVDDIRIVSFAPVANIPPVANPGGPYSGGVTQPISFNGSLSSDQNQDNLTYSWNFGDGSTSTLVNPSHAYTTAGNYTVTLTVNDGATDSPGASTTAVIALPTANPGGPYFQNLGSTTTFNGSNSVGTSGNALTYSWQFGDGSTATGQNPSRSYATVGTYTVTLTVEDGYLPSAPATTTVIVSSQSVPNIAPVITSISANPISITDIQASSITVVASDQDSGPQALSYTWSTSAGTITNNAATIIFTPPNVVSTQQVVITVVVSDGQMSVSESINVTVTDAGATELLNEQFNTDMNNWTVVDQGDFSAPSTWSVINNELVQSSNIFSNLEQIDDKSRLGTFIRYDNSIVWDNYIFTVNMTSKDDDAIGVMFRIQDDNNYYRFSWDKSRQLQRLVRNVNGVFSVLYEDISEYVVGANYTLKVTLDDSQANNIVISVNNIEVVSTSDNSFATGTIGLYSWANAGSYFDNVKVDKIAP